jgi:hypothetical protein
VVDTLFYDINTFGDDDWDKLVADERQEVIVDYLVGCLLLEELDSVDLIVVNLDPKILLHLAGKVLDKIVDILHFLLAII